MAIFNKKYTKSLLEGSLKRALMDHKDKENNMNHLPDHGITFNLDDYIENNNHNQNNTQKEIEIKSDHKDKLKDDSGRLIIDPEDKRCCNYDKDKDLMENIRKRREENHT